MENFKNNYDIGEVGWGSNWYLGFDKNGVSVDNLLSTVLKKDNKYSKNRKYSKFGKISKKSKLLNTFKDFVKYAFFNEFLTDELSKHRKVLEMVGSKMQTDESINQLSGLGFSSTNRASILVRITGSFNRVIKVVF